MPIYQEDSERQNQILNIERDKLESIINYIREKTIDIDKSAPFGAAHRSTFITVNQVMQGIGENLKNALRQPYFARVDYFDDNSMPRTIYIGGSLIFGTDVFSWTSPVAKLWYSDSNINGYTAPRGFIPTIVNLKRFLKISDANLLNVNDVFIKETKIIPDDGNTPLTEALSGTGVSDGHLQIIIETIEPDQYEKIANDTDKVMIVQGSAGSGKSEIGLHRVAYLLSPHNEIPERERPTSRTTLFVGPSSTFLEHVGDVLPDLNVGKEVQQTTFNDWLIGQFSNRPKRGNRIWNNLLSTGNMTDFDESAEKFKGTIAMADILERHVKEIADSIRKRCMQLDPIRIQTIIDQEVIEVKKEDIQSYLRWALPVNIQKDEYRLNKRRDNFINAITDFIADKGNFSRNVFSGLGLKIKMRELRQQVDSWCDVLWKEIDYRTEYVSLLSDTGGLLSKSKGSLEPETARLITDSIEKRMEAGFEDSDIGALAYLDHLLNQTVMDKNSHIIVDEAQDLSPIDFKMLRLSSSNNWFTVLGDTAQKLTPYRGLKSWRSLERVLGRSDIKIQRARKSYRSTKQITKFNNKILRLFDSNIGAPIPYERDGPKPEYRQHRINHDMYNVVVEELIRIRSLDGLQDAVIGILARDMNNLHRFREFCAGKVGIDLTQLKKTGSFNINGLGTRVMRIPESKGLEFDAVMVLGVNDSFSNTLFNQKLLYLATSRAKHYLAIHWSGKKSPILGSINNRGIKIFK